jgi:hypothetical protein
MNDLAVLDQSRPPALFNKRRSQLNQFAMEGVSASFAVLSYKGRNWRINYRGEETLLMDANGTPRQTIDVIIVGVSNTVSKIYYGKNYVEGSDDSPDCMSMNGQVPDVGVPKQQSQTCAMCPHNQWGSRITEAGKKGKACQDSRRLAVVPLADPLNESLGGPILLRIPPMTLQALASYAQLLERKGASIEFVGTRLGFDYNVAYPKITFTPLGWLSDALTVLVVGENGESGIRADPNLERMLHITVPSSPSPQQTEAAQQEIAQALMQAQPPLMQSPEAPQTAVAAAFGGATPTKSPPQQPQQASAPAPRSGPPRGRRPAAAAFGGEANQAQPNGHAAQSAAPANTPTTAEHAPEDLQAAIDALLDDPV